MPPEDSSTSSPQDPAPEALQPVPESPAPVVEVPAETPPPEAIPSTPESAPAPAEAVPALGTDQFPSQTGQIGGNDPLPPKPDPFDSPRQSSEQAAQDKPTPAPEPPSAAAPAQTGILRTARDLLVKARVTMQDRKRKKRDKIMETLNKKNKNGSTSSPQVTNDEVEKLLHISDATATRYLSVLVKEGKIKQIGTIGSGVAYTKI